MLNAAEEEMKADAELVRFLTEIKVCVAPRPAPPAAERWSHRWA